jgi:hypothetical protein
MDTRWRYDCQREEDGNGEDITQVKEANQSQ